MGIGNVSSIFVAEIPRYPQIKGSQPFDSNRIVTVITL